MLSLRRLTALFTLFFLLGACASGGGEAPADDTGTAALSLQLHGLEEGEIYLTQDGYRLTFEHFAFAFSAIRLGDFQTQAPFEADFYDEEVVDLVELEGIPAGEYDSVALSLGLAEGDSALRFLRVHGLKNAESVPPNLAGLSVFLQAQAVNGSELCTLQVALVAEGEILEVESGGEAVEVEAGEEAEILVEVDPNSLFSGVALGGLCSGEATVLLSSSENSDLADQVRANLGDAFLLGSSEGHQHAH